MSQEIKPKYPKPHILLMDLEPDVANHLREKGFDVEEGSFGTPYKLSESPPPKSFPLYLNGASLPKHFAEKEIVVIDLMQEIRHQVYIIGEPLITEDGDVFWAAPVYGVVDPRPIFMVHHQPDFDRIYDRGGIFIIFAGEEGLLNLIHHRKYNERKIETLKSSGFLSSYRGLHVIPRSGKEIRVRDGSRLSELLNKYATNSRYDVIFSSGDPSWISLAENKFDESVCGCLIPLSDQGDKGWVFVFPQFANKAEFLADLLLEVLPNIRPELFPYTEGMKWIYGPGYELPEVVQHEAEIRKVREESDRKITELKEKIDREHSAKKYLYDLLTETGDELVTAVETALKKLGFTDVANMDNELQESDENEPKREDLQIRDDKPLVLVEIKGITGRPRDSSALQVFRYLTPRMKSLDHTDVRGLSIINHQRNIPALDRKKNPFSEDVLGSAEREEIGLMTTWCLHKLVRNFLKLGWSFAQVKGLFYQDGFIEPIPSHYEYVGFVEKIWPQKSAIGIKIEEGELCLGDTIAYEFPVEFEEQKIESLQVDSKPVERVSVNQLAGILTELDIDKIKKKTRVFRVKSG